MNNILLTVDEAINIRQMLLMDIHDLERRGHKGKTSDGEPYESPTLTWVRDMHRLLSMKIEQASLPSPDG